jgi:hypothetical protein
VSVRRAIFTLLIALTVLALPLQFVIDPTSENIAAACIVLGSSLTVLLYVAGSEALETQPLSTFAILGFCVTSQLGALLVQTATWTALRSSLYDPIYTFGTLALYQGVAVLAHVTYRFFSVARPARVGFLRGLLDWAGVYRVPTSETLWIMGCIGLISYFFSRNLGVIGKVALAFNFLTWGPFLIPFYLSQVGDAYCNARRNKMLLGVFAMAMVVLGIGLNARGIMFAGVVTVGLLYLLAGMRSHAPLTRRSVIRIAALAVALAAVSVPLSDLATSMVIAREWRGKVSAPEMMRTTLRVWRNPKLIAAYRAGGEAASRYKSYDEHYIDNALLARFVGTKYVDNSLHFARTITTDDSKARLRDVSVKFLWAAVPGPVLHRLGININKEELGFSMGDYLAYLSRGLPLGAHKVGSMLAQGTALFGPLFPFVFAAICLVLFGVMDLLTIRPLDGAASLSALGMLQIWSFFNAGLVYEGLHTVFTFLIRSVEQMVLIYVFIFGLAQLLLRSKQAIIGIPTVPVWHRAE